MNSLPLETADHLSDTEIILSNTLEAFILAGLDGVIRAFNKKAEEHIFKNMQGRVRKGALIYEYMSAERAVEFRKLLVRVAGGETVEYDREYDVVDGTKAWVEFSLSPVREGETICAVCIKGREITHLKESQMLSQSLFDDGPVPMFVCEQKSLKYLQVNAAAVEHYGYSLKEFLSMSAFNIRVPQEHNALMAIMDNGSGGWNRKITGWHRRKDGGLLAVQVALHDIIYQGIDAILIVVTDVTDIMDLQKSLHREKLNKQRSITRATISAQEKERLTIGSELHDNVNQMLASAKLLLTCFLEHPEHDRGLVRKSVNTLKNAIEEIRNLSHQLVPPLLGELGLTHAIEELGEAMGFDENQLILHGLDILDDQSVCEELKLCLYRIFQEQFSNIAKYAMASKITVTGLREENSLLIHVRDNGKGFDPSAVKKGIGLTNISNRASLFDGKIEITSVIGEGTCMVLHFPLAGAALALTSDE